MDYKPYQGDPNAVKFADDPLEQPSMLKKGAQFLTGLGFQAATAPVRVAETVDKLLSYVEPERNPRSVQYGEGKPYPTERLAAALPKEWIAPENWFSKGLQATAGNWPLLFIGGAPGALKVGSDIAGSLAMSAAESAGLGPIGQIGSSILASRGFGNAVNKIKGVNATKDFGKVGLFKKDLYDQEAKIGSQIPVDAIKVKENVNSILDNTKDKLVSTYGFTPDAKNRAVHNIELIQKKLSKPNLTASDIFQANRDLNSIWAPKKSIENSIYKHLQSALQEELSKLYETHPPYGNVAKGANELHKIENWQTGLGRWAKEASDQGFFKKLGQTTISTLGGLLGGSPFGYGAKGALGGAALGAGKHLAASGITKGHDLARGGMFANELMKTKEGSKLLWEIVADSAKGATESLTKHISKLDHMAKKFDRENPEGWRPYTGNPDDVKFAD